MNLGTLTDSAPGIVAALSALLGILGGLGGGRRMRGQIKADAELISALPEGPAKDALLSHVSRRVEELIEYETTKTRDVPMFVFTLLMIIGLGALTMWLLLVHAWWAYLLALGTLLLWAVFLYGAWDTGVKAVRDEKGNRVPI